MGEEKGGINLFEELGVSDERAHEISVEIRTIAAKAEYLTEILSAIPEKYDRESIILGVFLCEMILDNDGRLSPSGNEAIIAKEIMDELLKEIESDIVSEMEESKTQPKGDQENN